MKTAIAISAMMRNVLSVAKIPPATVAASQVARIAPMIVPMIRPMYPVCARFPWQAAVVPAVSARAGAVRAAWHIWPGRRLVTGGHGGAVLGAPCPPSPRSWRARAVIHPHATR